MTASERSRCGFYRPRVVGLCQSWQVIGQNGKYVQKQLTKLRDREECEEVASDHNGSIITKSMPINYQILQKVSAMEFMSCHLASSPVAIWSEYCMG